ncbi:MAG: hypothetical protein GY694_11485, partial [Gammaproteobacteria bacterium]|nr:hypothetical protein [Gammaproteobacteria bacterium]
FTDADYIYGSLNSESIASRRNIINAVDLSVEYRYQRLKERQMTFDLNDGLSAAQYACKQYTTPYPVTSKLRMAEAIENTGWEIIGDITYQEMPPGATYQPCGVVFLPNTTLARGCTATIGKRYAQTVTEKYTIRIESADSIAALGEIAILQSASIQTNYDLTNWNNSTIADGWSDYGTPSTDINSDSYVNQDDDTERQNAIDTAINLAATKLLKSHRNNKFPFEIPYHQNIDVIHTAKVQTTKLTAKGKVSNVVKTIDTFSGEAVCHVTIRLSKKFGVGVPSADNPPAIPDGLPTVEDAQSVDLIPEVHLGGQDDTEYDPGWAGWITDYVTVTEPGHVAYPTEFVVNTPDITL